MQAYSGNHESVQDGASLMALVRVARLPAAMASSMAWSMAWHSGGVPAADMGDISPSPRGVSLRIGDMAIRGDSGMAAGVQPV